MKTLSIFNKNEQITKTIKKIILNCECHESFKTLEHYLKTKQIKFSSEELNHLRLEIEHKLLKQIRYFCFLQYHYMNLSHNWGDAGKQQVQVAFCRTVCQIPPDHQLSHLNTMEFHQKVESTLSELDINSKTEQVLEDEVRDYVFNILGTQFTFHEINILDQVLRFIGSDHCIQGGFYGHEKELIFGVGTREDMGEYIVIRLEKELMRSANAIVAMAAAIGDKQIFIRKESLITIFYHKWKPVYQRLSYTCGDNQELLWKPSNIHDLVDSIAEMSQYDYIYKYISEAIKIKTLAIYQSCIGNDIGLIQPFFVEDMSETILRHELGHGVIQNYIIPMEFATIGEATKVCGENIITAFLEFLADFAPLHKGIFGPFRNMAIQSHSNKSRAERMFYMYLSDTWFFDTEDEYMYLYSEFLALSMIHHMDDKGKPLFRRLSLNTTQKDNSLLSWCLDRCVTIIKKIQEMSTMAVYETEKGSLDYKEMSKNIHKKLEADIDDPSLKDSYGYHTAYWTHLLDKLATSSSHSAAIMELYETEKEAALRDFLILIAGAKKAKEFRYDIRAYIVYEMGRRGLICRS